MKKRIRTTLMSMLAIALLLSIVALPALATPPTDDENDISDTPSLCELEDYINDISCYYELEYENSEENDLSETHYEIIHLTMEEFCEMVIANTYGNPSFNPYNGYLIAGQFFVPPVAEQDPNGDYTVPHLCTHHAPIPNFMPFNNYRLWHVFEGFVQGEGGQQGRYRAYFRGQNNVAFCATPEFQAMTSRFYDVAMIQTPSDNPLLARIMYYGYGGPSGANLWGYSVTHWMVAHAYPGSSFNGSSVYSAQIAQANARPLPPCGFLMVFYGNAGEWLVSDTGSNQRRQRFVTWNYTPAGHLEIIKVSSNPTISEGNPLYSLEGAVFNVFSGSTLLGTITTNAEGRGRLDNIDSRLTGLHLVEVQPPMGFALNPTQIPFEIVSNQTTTVTVENRPQNDPPAIILRKRDADTNSTTPQGNAGLAGAEFTLRFYAGIFHTAEELSNVTPIRTWVVRTDANGIAFLHQDYLVSGDPFFFAGNNDPTLPLGTLTIQESRPPEGYLINDELFIRHITSYGHAESVFTFSAPIVPEEVIRGGVHVEKWDIERNQAGLTQGDATLAGTVFEIINRSTNSVFVNGTLHAPGAVVHTMTTTANGVAVTANDLLPFGTYEVRERTAPTGYLPTGVLSQTFNITQNRVIVRLNTENNVIKNNIIRGGVEIEKWDIELNESGLKQGDAVLSGAVFEIINRSADSVIVNGTLFAPGTVVHTMTTNVDGLARTSNNLLPFGTYEIRERTAPTGYLPTGVISRTFNITQQGVVVSLRDSDTAIKNDIIRGGVYVEKWDNEIAKNQAQGAGTLEGAIFEIVNRSANSVLVQGTLFSPGEVVYTMTPTDVTGATSTENYLLPFGTYEIREIAPPFQGYLARGVLSRTFKIREHGVIVELNTEDTAIRNDPIRGDIRGVKISEGDAQRLANVPFRITSLTTGEYHVVVTNINGEFNTSSSWNPHSQYTNRGETCRDGVWFGDINTLNDDVGALLFDRYLIEELPAESNAGKEMLRFELTIYRHMHVVDLGTLTNIRIPTPEIFTSAMDRETTSNDAFVSDSTTIIDTVYFSGLTSGRDYTVRGILMDRKTGEPLLVNGEQVTAGRTFRAFSNAGTVTVEFGFSSLTLQGKSIVVFQYLYYDGELIAKHADIDCEFQTITFKVPSLKTFALGADGNKIIPLDPNAVVIDTVTFENLMPGRTYTLVGILMDKATERPVLVNGETVTAHKRFTARESSGSVDVVFTFDSTELEGKTLVVFQYLYFNGELIAEHADINDEGQTVTIATREPEPETTPEPDKTTGVGAQTGQDGLPVLILVIGIGAAVGAVSLIVIKRRRKSE